MTLYGLVSIVRNEELVIDRFLDSAMAVCVVATVLDTGSTDHTVERIEARGLTALSRPFDDFGQSRSAVLKAARGTAAWLLTLDADMTVEIDPDFVPDPEVDAYLVGLDSAAGFYRLPLLLNGDLEWVSIGSTHEYTCLADGTPGRREPTDAVRITHHADGASRPDKLARDGRLLEAELTKEPDNPRTVFYLAQTLADLGLADAARDMYFRRALMGGFDEERFVAAYRGALLVDEWPQRRDRLWQAWMLRPSRLEAAYALARSLNEHDDHSLAYAVASVPSRVAGGALSKDILFVEPAAWDFGLDFERHVAAWYVGRYAESQAIGRDLLTRDLPANIRAAVERNMEFGPREG